MARDEFCHMVESRSSLNISIFVSAEGSAWSRLVYEWVADARFCLRTISVY